MARDSQCEINPVTSFPEHSRISEKAGVVRPRYNLQMKRARFEVLREASVPSILIEGGFLSHPAEGKKILDPAYRKQMAHAIVQGVLAYKKLIKG